MSKEMSDSTASSIFCPKCHRLAAQIFRDDNRVRLMQNGKSLLSLSKGSTGNSIGIKCPSGHSVMVTV